MPEKKCAKLIDELFLYALVIDILYREEVEKRSNEIIVN